MMPLNLCMHHRAIIVYRVSTIRRSVGILYPYGITLVSNSSILASFPGLPRFYLSFVFTIFIHRSRRLCIIAWMQTEGKNGGRLGTGLVPFGVFITYIPHRVLKVQSTTIVITSNTFSSALYFCPCYSNTLQNEPQIVGCYCCTLFLTVY